MDNILFVTIIIILLADFGFERFLALLNIKNSKLGLPQILSDIYDSEKYTKQQEYFRVNSKFGLISFAYIFLIMFGMYASGGFGWLNSPLQLLIFHEFIRFFVFFGIIFCLSTLF